MFIRIIAVAVAPRTQDCQLTTQTSQNQISHYNPYEILNLFPVPLAVFSPSALNCATVSRADATQCLRVRFCVRTRCECERITSLVPSQGCWDAGLLLSSVQPPGYPEQKEITMPTDIGKSDVGRRAQAFWIAGQMSASDHKSFHRMYHTSSSLPTTPPPPPPSSLS